MERLKAATARAKQGMVDTDITLPRPTDEQRRRAFDGLAGHIRSPEMETQAKDALTRSAEAVGAEREAMARRIGQALGLEAPDVHALAGAVTPTTSRGWVPVLFASAAMPVSTLRAYAGQLERAGGVIALRGMVGGMTKVGPTAKLSAEILRIDPGCDGPACAMRNVQLIIDPLLFRQHHVAQVPALAMVPGDPTLPYCERDDASPVASHIIYGDAALSGLLAEYARLGGKQEVADAQARLDRR
ncbi:MAG TPA: type-F conjugative transfer system pilin assembly protein TrbC [Sphingobium sp.]|uniref:type-F conjugative transfer system pilin assembly protein TrbC n=1 Tax=Sphingobium sp. TaxID=1912891 RepID=UPI002ED2B641